MRLLDLFFVRLGPASPDGPPPLDPSAENARQQLAHELGGGNYAAARPSIVDTVIQWLENWFNSLLSHVSGGPAIAGSGGLVIVIIVVVVVAAAVVGFFVFGLPRINRRSSVTGALFGDEDERDSDALRRAAEKAAAAGDFATAVEEEFRAIARGLAERVVVITFPGTTAHGFALQAAVTFPSFERALTTAADDFDGVRYLGRSGTEESWLAVRSLEAGLRAARPVLDAATR